MHEQQQQQPPNNNKDIAVWTQILQEFHEEMKVSFEKVEAGLCPHLGCKRKIHSYIESSAHHKDLEEEESCYACKLMYHSVEGENQLWRNRYKISILYSQCLAERLKVELQEPWTSPTAATTTSANTGTKRRRVPAGTKEKTARTKAKTARTHSNSTRCTSASEDSSHKGGESAQDSETTYDDEDESVSLVTVKVEERLLKKYPNHYVEVTIDEWYQRVPPSINNFLDDS